MKSSLRTFPLDQILLRTRKLLSLRSRIGQSLGKSFTAQLLDGWGFLAQDLTEVEHLDGVLGWQRNTTFLGGGEDLETFVLAFEAPAGFCNRHSLELPVQNSNK